MRENSATPKPHPALNHRCPFCHADPGQPCRKHRGRGAETDWPHTRRQAIVDSWYRRNHERPTEQALCCECGNLRSYKKARNFVAERTDHRTWHRMTGELRCEVCDRITRHALLRSGEHRDAAEGFQRVALGDQPADQLEDVDRARREYRQGLPRNPYLNHRYWMADAREAWAGGQREILGLCGEPMELDYDPDGPAGDHRELNALIEPSEVRVDQEYEDPKTGLWWVEMDCVDCLRIANEQRRGRQRTENLKRIREVLNALTEECLTVDNSRALRDVLEKIASEHGVDGT